MPETKAESRWANVQWSTLGIDLLAIRAHFAGHDGLITSDTSWGCCALPDLQTCDSVITASRSFNKSGTNPQGVFCRDALPKVISNWFSGWQWSRSQARAYCSKETFEASSA
jgi:hypothetical protein